jgi:hypothetical protein
MIGGNENESERPAYSGLTQGELLALASDERSLDECARRALAVELRRRGSGETDIAAFQRDAERARSRRARWRGAQWMRLRELFFLILVLPAVTILVFGLSGLLGNTIVSPTLHDVLGLSQRAATYGADLFVVGTAALYLLVAVLFLRSKRADTWIRRWLPGSDENAKSNEQKLRAHGRFCPARNLSYALLLLLFSLYCSLLSLRDVEGWRFLQPPSSANGWSYTETASAIFLVVFCSYLLAKAPCFREKLWLVLAAADFLLDLPKHVLRPLDGGAVGFGRGLSLGLWVAAALVALSFVKSAWRGPAARDMDHRA